MDKRKYTIMAAVTAAVFGAIGYYYYQKRDSIDEALKKNGRYDQKSSRCGETKDR